MDKRDATLKADATPRHRDAAVDSLRGIAIVLMVAGHVIGGTSAEGMNVAAESGWRYSYDLLVDMRMPLFTAISGFVYGFRPLRDRQRFGSFLRGKSRRLLVPLLTVGTVFVVVQALAPGTNSDTTIDGIWRLYVYGLAHFWFLQSIFLIFLVVGVVEAFGLFRDPRALVLAIVIAALASMFIRVPAVWDVFSLSGFVRLMPFFLLGRFFSVYMRSCHWGGYAVLLATIILLAVRAAVVFEWARLPALIDTAIGVLLGIAAISSLLLFRNRLSWRPLALLGYFSYGIYLLHVFGTAPTRMLLRRFGIDSEPLVFLAALAMGLLVPVLFEVTVGRLRWASWAFLGQRPFRVAPVFGDAGAAPGRIHRDWPDSDMVMRDVL